MWGLFFIIVAFTSSLLGFLGPLGGEPRMQRGNRAVQRGKLVRKLAVGGALVGMGVPAVALDDGYRGLYLVLTTFN